MLKKFICKSIVFITLFSFWNVIYAYDYYDAENEDNVNDMINEIYDAKQQYIDLAGDEVEDDAPEIIAGTSTSYWWPVGSAETVEVDGIEYATGEPETLTITSNWGYRSDPFTGERKKHNGVDISGGRGLGLVNIIAAKDGVVVYPTADIPNDCPVSNRQNVITCRGYGYGNYVVIQHSDGNYTLYAHMHEGTITVKAGDKVQQGQVIGKMGSSGNSTGMHLHFEVRVGNNVSTSTDDPLNYISIENPREVYNGNKLLEFINSWEGSSPIIGNFYEVENIGDGVRTVGSGVTLEYNAGRFKKYGIDVAKYPVGSTIPISIVDQIKLEIISEKRTYIENVIANNSIILQEYQIDALTSMMYNCGNINGFVENYKAYGNTQEFYENWFFRNIMKGSKFEKGLTRRRNAEWALFHTGNYNFN